MRLHAVTPGGASLAYLDLPGPDLPGPDLPGPDQPGPGEQATVFIAGLGSSSLVDFTPVAGHPAVAGRGRSLLVDLLGSGWSDHDDDFSHTIEDHAAAVGDLLDAVGLAGVRLVGHSLGGSVAIVLAHERPDLVVDLVVAEPNLDPGVGTLSRLISAFTEDDFAAAGHARLVADLLAEAADGDDNAAVFARTLRRWSSRGLHRSAVSLLAERRPTFREQLAALPGTPTYLSGARTGEDLEPLRTAGCDVRVIPDAGHALMHDNLDGFVSALGRRAPEPPAS